MMIAVIGKGGAGKTTLSSLLLRRLLEARQTPILAIDADPSSCLGSVLGVASNGTLGELREGFRDDSERPASLSKGEWIALEIEQAAVEASGFSLLTMGRPEGPGCYCFVNNLLREHLDRLGRTYRHVLLDCEAGLEHLSRRTAGRPDRLVCVVNRSRMAADTIRRGLGLYLELHGRLPMHRDLILNGFEPGEPLADEQARRAAGETAGFTRTWTVPLDPTIPAFDAKGRSLLELKSDSPALRAIQGWEEAS